MSGRRTSGTSRPSLGVQVLAVFSFLLRKSQFDKCLGEHVEVPDIRLPDIRTLLNFRVHSRVQSREHFRERVRGPNCSVLH